MTFRLLADLVVVIHGGFVLFAVLGGLLVLAWPRWAWLHLPALLWAGFIELTGGICPLTPLENWLRALGSQEVYRGEFIDRYVMPILYPDGLTQGNQILLGSFVLALNVAIYAALWHRRKRTRTVEHPCRQGESPRPLHLPKGACSLERQVRRRSTFPGPPCKGWNMFKRR